MGLVSAFDIVCPPLGTKVMIYRCVEEHLRVMEMYHSNAHRPAKVVKNHCFHGNPPFFYILPEITFCKIKSLVFITNVPNLYLLKAFAVYMSDINLFKHIN